MKHVNVRRWGNVIFSVLTTGLIVAAITLPPSHIPQFTETQSATVFASAITLATTLGGLLGLIFFITAQVRPSGLGNAGLRILYRDQTFPTVVAALVITLTASILGLAIRSSDMMWSGRLACIALVGCLFVTWSAVPISMLAYENMRPDTAAKKILQDLNANTVARYGLVDILRGETGQVTISLRSDGLDYSRHDPLRAFHELVQQAILAKDRLLLGNLLSLLFERVAKILDAPWPSDSLASADWRIRAKIRSRIRFPQDDQLAVAVHALHYVVRLARNLKRDWGSLDVGRHSAEYNIAKFAACLAARHGTEAIGSVALTAIARISLEYKDITPYGRVEPLNLLSRTIRALDASNRSTEVSLALSLIALIECNTKQLSDGRGDPLYATLTPEHTMRLDAIRRDWGEELWKSKIKDVDPWRA
ncbi:hypothetical protein [Nostocoides vanveenii]|uniref:hypothetical protein n=1 Tax=Nostocoides vanveenii TaxID=330835 RepID=UPI0031D46677